MFSCVVLPWMLILYLWHAISVLVHQQCSSHGIFAGFNRNGDPPFPAWIITASSSFLKSVPVSVLSHPWLQTTLRWSTSCKTYRCIRPMPRILLGEVASIVLAVQMIPIFGSTPFNSSLVIKSHCLYVIAVAIRPYCSDRIIVIFTALVTSCRCRELCLIFAFHVLTF